MSVRRVMSVLSVCLVASATVVVAQPKNDPSAPVAPAKDAEGSAAGSGAAQGSAVEMVEDPPADMDGIDENPDAPRTDIARDPATKAIPEKRKAAGFPIEEALRPITLPANMSEVSLGITAPLDPFVPTAVLRARYGITRQVQLGLTYVVAGIYDDPGTMGTDKSTIHPGKAVGLDVTVLAKDWIGVRVGVPVYIDPVAISLQLGAPLRFQLLDGKLAIGGLEDLLTIRLYRFPPSLTSEVINADAAARFDNNSIQSRGAFRISGFGIYQQSTQMALIARAGISLEDFSGTRSTAGGGSTTFLRAGLQYSVRPFIDLGFSIGWEDLSVLGSFAPAAYAQLRI